MKRSPIYLLGWLLLFHVVASLLGLGLLFLTFDLFGDSPELMFFGQCILPCGLLWGFLTPQKARVELRSALGMLGGYALLMWLVKVFLPDYAIIVALPQVLAGTGLAALWPGSHGSAWFLWTFEPMVQSLTFLLLPACVGVGLLLSKRRSGHVQH